MTTEEMLATIDRLTAARDRALACEAAARGLLRDDVEILTGDVRRRDEMIAALRTRLAESEAEVGRLRDTLEAVTECEEHRPCGLCRERVRRAVEVKP